MMITVRALIWFAVLVLAAMAMLGCEMRIENLPVPQGVWRQQAMTGGPSIYWTCVNGDRIYAMQRLSERGSSGLWPGASIAVAEGGCR